MDNILHFDLIICGAGMAGASLACALKDSPIKIAVIEALPHDFTKHPGFDARAIALSHGSLQLLDKMGIGHAIRDKSTNINQIHISDRGHIGLTQLTREEYLVDELGAVIELVDAGKILHNILKQSSSVTLFCPNTIKQITRSRNQVSLTLDSGQALSGQLLIGADGSQSSVKSRLNIASTHFNFRQAAVIANVRSTEAHKNRAFERFTDTGPLALLPLSNERWSLVWSIKEQEMTEFSQLSDNAFLLRLQQRFGNRVGRFTHAGTRSIYPLQLIQAQQAVSHRVVLLGNAAHQLHPIAGQGYNLGLRDTYALAQCIENAVAQGEDIGSFSKLEQYKRLRKTDSQITINLTSQLATLFASQQWPIITGRNLGLILMQHCPQLKAPLAWQTMGRTSTLKNAGSNG